MDLPSFRPWLQQGWDRGQTKYKTSTRVDRHGQFVQACGEIAWPDGSAETQYTFQQALQRGAHRGLEFQAIEGLGLMEPLPSSPTRLTHELQLCPLPAQGFMATTSHTAEEVEQSLLRAREPCEQAGDIPR